MVLPSKTTQPPPSRSTFPRGRHETFSDFYNRYKAFTSPFPGRHERPEPLTTPFGPVDIVPNLPHLTGEFSHASRTPSQARIVKYEHMASAPGLDLCVQVGEHLPGCIYIDDIQGPSPSPKGRQRLVDWFNAVKLGVQTR